MRGFAPARRGSFALLRTGSFVSAKGPKTIGARASPSGCLCPSPGCLGCGTRFAQTVLAPEEVTGLGRSHARRRREMKPFVGASFFLSLSVILDIFNRGSSVFAFSFVKARDDTQVVPYRNMVPARRGGSVCLPCFSCSISKEKDTGFPLKACGTDRREGCPTLHVAIDCQRKSHDNGGTVVREKNCTITP